jgi:branched-chain amino acid aminotransferase
MSQPKPSFAYFRGEIVPIEQATVSVMTHALNYGTAVFGGMRGYWNDDEQELFVFRPLDHFKRFLNSSRLLRMELNTTNVELTNNLRELLRTEGYQGNTYIRPLAYKSEGMMSVQLHGIKDEITIFAFNFGKFVANEDVGLHACFSSWQRVSDTTMRH